MNAMALLRVAGWYPGRAIEVDLSVQALMIAGYWVTDATVQLLREYTGLDVTSADAARGLWIDGTRAAAWADLDWCRAYEAEAGVGLVPFGGYSHMTLLVDEGGSVWGGYDAEFGRLGGSLEDTVDALLVRPGSVRLDRRIG